VDDTGGVKRPREVLAEQAHLLGVGLERLADPLLDLLARVAEGDYAGQVGEVATPATVVGLLEDDDVLGQRRFSSPLALRMLESVPAGTVWLSFPATTMRAGVPG
jgi:hypothetical protein